MGIKKSSIPFRSFGVFLLGGGGESVGWQGRTKRMGVSCT